MIWQIVSKMRTIHRYSFSLSKAAHILPVHFCVAKAGPAVGSAFYQEILHAAFLWRRKEQLARVRIVKSKDIGGVSSLPHKGGFLIVARVFRVMAT